LLGHADPTGRREKEIQMLTHESKKLLSAGLAKLGLLCTENNPCGVVIQEAEHDSGQKMLGYVQVADDHAHSVVKETELARILDQAKDSEQFWQMLREVEI
jgi:hypothetical protein